MIEIHTLSVADFKRTMQDNDFYMIVISSSEQIWQLFQ